MKAVILTNGQSNQAVLVQKLSNVVDIGAIVVSRNKPRKVPSLRQRAVLSINKLAGRTVGASFVRAWNDLLEYYRSQLVTTDSIPRVNLANVNDEKTVETIRSNSPCLVIVSGTNIVGRKVIEAARQSHGIVNLHTGISPYVRGGPNCTNWCLSRGWFHLIGNTVMWLNEGIDTGNIIATEKTPLDGTESLSGLHIKVMEHAHALYVRAVSYIAAGKPVPSIPQADIGPGTDLFGADWNASAMLAATRNFSRGYRSFFDGMSEGPKAESGVKLVRLDDA